MTVKESRKFVAVLMVTYPNYNPIDAELAADTWADITKEYSYEQVNAALGIYMKTNKSGFAPVPGQIIENIHTMTDPQELNEMEAWAMVSKAIRNSGYNSVEEFSNFPPLVQEAVGLPDQLRIWALDEGYREDVVRSHFISCYKSVLQREKEYRKLPCKARNLIKKTNSSSDSAKIEQKRREIVANFEERKQERERAIEVKDIIAQAPDSYYELIEQLGGEEIATD